MPLTDEQRKKVQALLAQVETPAPSPQPIAPVSGLQFQGATVKTPQGTMRFGVPTASTMGAQERADIQTKSVTERALKKKAADQKLQLEQAIGLFGKIFDEADKQIPVIGMPALTLPAQRVGRWAGKELGLRETQRGAIASFQARATPALKALGEVGVLTDQDIKRILSGGFPADDDSVTTRKIKRAGLLSDFQAKLDQVNQVLGADTTEGVPALDDPLGIR